MTPQETIALANSAPSEYRGWIYAAVFFGGAVPIVTGILAVWLPTMMKKKDSANEGQRIANEERKALSSDRQLMMDFIKGDNKDLRDQRIVMQSRINELEDEVEKLRKDRDKGWGIARAWFQKAMRFLHDWNNLVQVYTTLHPEKNYRRPPNKLPRFEEIEETASEDFNEDDPLQKA